MGSSICVPSGGDEKFFFYLQLVGVLLVGVRQRGLRGNVGNVMSGRRQLVHCQV